MNMKISKRTKTSYFPHRNIKGMSYPMICVLIIILATIFSIILLFSSIIVHVDTMKENSKVVLDGFVITNATDIFNSIKNGNNYVSEIDAEDYCKALKKYCTFDGEDNLLYNYDKDGKEIYHITRPTLEMVTEDELKLKASYEISIPLRFAGTVITTATVPIEIKSLLTEKF